MNKRMSTMIFPLAFVVAVSMVKDIFEDIERHQSDKKENKQKVLVGDPQTGKFSQKLWKDVHVGMVVKVERDKYFPADLILLNSSAPKGICYIETKDLDGETNLKHKQAEKKVLDILGANAGDAEVLQALKGAFIECENPNDQLYRFEGTMYIRETVAPLSVDQVLLRGSNLRNTDFIYGLVVFTGHETKVMKNQVQAKAKLSKLERKLNQYIILIVIIQLIMSVVAAFLNALVEVVHSNDFYVITGGE